MANLRNTILKIVGDPADAKAALADVTGELRKFETIDAEARADIKTEGAQAKLEKLMAQLERYRQQEPSPEVKIKTAGVLAQIERLEAKLAELDRQGVEIDTADAERKLARIAEGVKAFDGLTPEARLNVKIGAAEAELAAFRAQFAALDQEEATPEVKVEMARALVQIERLEASLAKLNHTNVEVNVDVKRGALDRVTSSLVGGLAGIGAAFGGSGGNPIRLFGNLLGELPPQAQAAGAAIALALIPAIIALAASLAAAVAGLGALAVAFAAALGPAVLVTVAAFASLAKILKAVQERHQKSADQARAVATAQDQITSATESLASAQSNLKDQTTAAYTAWSDSIEAVKDDLLSVQHAQLGIEQSQLRVKQAQQALKDFRKEVGASGGDLTGLFKKFTDVNFKGDPGAIKSALAAQGVGLSDDQSLKLQQLILDIKDAKLGERDATDRLHDSNTKLKQDRKTEADFAANGIAAYKPYITALGQVATAQRSLAGAERSRTNALQDQSKAWKDLTPAEKKFADTILLVEARIKRAFGPALTALFGGLADGLLNATAALNDKKVVGAFQTVGDAIGSVFRTLGKTLSSPEIVNSFVTLAKGGADLVKVLGTKVFSDLFVILTRIAVAALPDLLEMFKSIGDWFGRLNDGTKNSEKLRAKIHDLIESTKLWLGFILKVGEGFIKLVGFASGAGDTILKALLAPRDTLRSLGRALGLTATDTKDLRQAARNLWTAFMAVATVAAPGIRQAVRGVGTVVRGVVRLVVGLLSGDWATAWNGAKDIVLGSIHAILGIFQSVGDLGDKLGHAIGAGIRHGIEKGWQGLPAFLKDQLNTIIGFVNYIIRQINALTPGAIKIAGHTITPGIKDIGTIKPLADGGVAVRAMLAQIGEAGPEAVIPLRSGVLAQLGKAIAAASAPQMAPALAAAGSHGTRVGDFHAHITTPDGGLPDVETMLSQLGTTFRKMGRG